MILPIKLTGKLGLPGQGVPSFTINPLTGKVYGDGLYPQGASVADPITGELAVSEPEYSNDPGLWDRDEPWPPPGILATGALRDSRGTQWSRRGSYQTESDFDKWRRAGKPTACSMRGMGATAQEILTAIAAGADAAAGRPYYGNYRTPGYNQGSGGTVTVSGAANPMAWIFGGLIVVGLVWAVARR